MVGYFLSFCERDLRKTFRALSRTFLEVMNTRVSCDPDKPCHQHPPLWVFLIILMTFPTREAASIAGLLPQASSYGETPLLETIGELGADRPTPGTWVAKPKKQSPKP